MTMQELADAITRGVVLYHAEESHRVLCDLVNALAEVSGGDAAAPLASELMGVLAQYSGALMPAHYYGPHEPGVRDAHRAALAACLAPIAAVRRDGLGAPVARAGLGDGMALVIELTARE